ncbi:MAG: MiaB/RimO family radical SAM methylthiotransferase [Phycisphaerae bacterium]
MPTFSITTLGCKVNQYESAAISTTLRALGFEPATGKTPPSLIVVNTCCITTTAMAKSRQAIRRQLRGAAGAHVFVAGCYGDYDRSAVGKLLQQAGVAANRMAIAGHHEDTVAALRSLAEGLLDGPDRRKPAARRDEECMRAGSTQPQAGDSNRGMSTSILANRARAVEADAPGTAHFGPIDLFPGHQRAFVKIQDGCDAFCSYCVVPYTRPKVWSRGESVILTECRNLVSAGHKEIVLCGVFLGAWGRNSTRRSRWDDAPSPLPELLNRVGRIEGLWRVRLSSIEPGDVTDRLLAVYHSNPTVAPHLHLPLQSGSDEILQAMNRQYKTAEFLAAVEAVRDRLDRPALSADIIVGFPGETEEHFQQTLDVARRAGFCKIHAFGFSPIPGSAAWKMRHQAPRPEVVKDRSARLAELETELAADYRRQFVGDVVEVLVERPSKRETRSRHGLTDRYLTVRFPCPGEISEPTGQVVRARIDRVTDEGLSGTLQTTRFP